MFNFTINYNNPQNGATALFNGNISETSWSSLSTNNTANPVSSRYVYSYDALNRLTGATSDAGGNYNLSNVTYDKMGNILSLKRNGYQGGSVFTNMDILSYEYHQNTNQLKNINDTGNASYGFKDGSELTTEYTYDANGNMLTNTNKNITSIEYNYLNMPSKITVAGVNAGVLEYKYSADGIKLRKIKTQGGVTTTTDYASSFIYENNTLKQFYHPEGYVENNAGNFVYVYQYMDIWKNTRLTYSDTNNDGFITQNEIRREQNYYPFGLEHVGYNGNIVGVKSDLRQYQNQEFTEDLGLNTHEWKYRISDPATGRFWQVDPLAEDYVYNSTYAFQENKMGMGVELEGLELGPLTNPANMFNFVPGKKPVLTFGLHNIVLPTVERKTHGGAGAFVDNVLGNIWNGIATSWNEGMQGKTLTEMTVESVRGMEEMADRVTSGEATMQDAESVAAMVLVKKVKKVGGNKPSIKSQALDVKKTLNDGKNSVNVKTVNGVTHYDLDGATHKGVETPHVQQSYNHTNPKTGQTYVNKDRKNVRPMNQQDIRTVKKVLEKRKENQ